MPEVQPSNWTQEQINELVERFYAKLLHSEPFIRMFTERNVDIELLKERQRAFLARLANGVSASGASGASGTSGTSGEVQQVRERHAFAMDPNRSAIWIETMRTTIGEMDVSEEKKEALFVKIKFLLDKMAESQANPAPSDSR